MKNLYKDLDKFLKIRNLSCNLPKERVRKKNIKRLKRNFNNFSILFSMVDGKLTRNTKRVIKESMKVPLIEYTPYNLDDITNKILRYGRSEAPYEYYLKYRTMLSLAKEVKI